MSNTLFQGIFDTDMTGVISISDFLRCVGCALVIGLILSGTYMCGTKYTKSFVATLAASGGSLCSYYDGKWKCGNRRGCCRRFQPSTISFSSRFCQRNRSHFSCHVFRSCSRNGISSVCAAICIDSRWNDAVI